MTKHVAIHPARAVRPYAFEQQWIGGVWRAGGRATILDITNPFTGGTLGTIPRADGRSRRVHW